VIASIDYAGVGQLCVGLATLVAAVAALRKSRTVETKVDLVSHAVNGKPPGATTLVSQVQDLTNKAFPPEEDAILPLLRRIAAGVERTEQQNGTSP
jgi:hypothetical protein